MNDKRKPILWEKVFKIRVINPTGWSMQHGQLVKKGLRAQDLPQGVLAALAIFVLCLYMRKEGLISKTY